jgi:hypothetical protein
MYRTLLALSLGLVILSSTVQSAAADPVETCSMHGDGAQLTVQQTDQSPWVLRINGQVFASDDGFDGALESQRLPGLVVKDATNITRNGQPTSARLVLKIVNLQPDQGPGPGQHLRLNGILYTDQRVYRFSGPVSCTTP